LIEYYQQDLYSEVKTIFNHAVSKFSVCHLDYYTNIANKSDILQMSVEFVF